MQDQSEQRIIDDPTQVSPMLRLLIALLITLLAIGLGNAVLSLSTSTAGLTQIVNSQMAQSGVSHPVTAVLLNFRGYDTLLEMVVLLLALLGVWAIGEARYQEIAPGPVLDTFARLLVPILILVAVYLLWVGAHAPGGAFQAGSILGAAGVLLLLSGWRPRYPLMALPLRMTLILGPMMFVAIAAITFIIEGQLLTFPVNQAGTLILILETAATLSIGITLAALFLGGQPQYENEKSK